MSEQWLEGLNAIDYEAEADKICKRIQQLVRRDFKRKGAIVAMSGGIDSSVVAGLCVRALGSDHVFGLLMPERHSSGDTLPLSQGLAESLGVEFIYENISGILESVGCYQRQDDAIRKVIPEYGDGWKSKIVLPSVIDSDSFRVFSVVAVSPDGEEIRRRMTTEAYLGVVAATNFKQRVRKMLEYYHADRLNYAVAGTPNRLEYDQGFFVKLGDGAADFKPIAHLYKTQVYAMAEFLKLPENIRSRPPTTDTYSMPQGQDEFYFSLPYDKMDICLYGMNQGVGDEEVAKAAGLTVEQLGRVYRDIEQKRRTTAYLHASPQLVEPVSEIAKG